MANTERLFVYDPQWQRVADISHPWMAAIHDILADEEGVWVTCTGADLLLKVSWTGDVLQQWTWRDDPELLRRFGYRRIPPFDPDVNYRDPNQSMYGAANSIHLNALGRHDDELLLSFGRILTPSVYAKRRRRARIAHILQRYHIKRPGWMRSKSKVLGPLVSEMVGSTHAIVSLTRNGQATVVHQQGGTRVPNHNSGQYRDALMYNDSNRGELVVLSPTQSVDRLTITIPGQHNFVRGLSQTGERRFMVGNQRPAAIYEVQIDTAAVIRRIDLEGEPNESVYCICPLPEHFDTPSVL